jgi:hypothetical protein
MAFILIIIILLWLIMDIKKYAKEAFIIRKARKNDLPMLILEEIGTGLAEVILGKKDEKGAPVFTTPDGQMLVDPAFLRNHRPGNWGSGLMVHHYATSQYQPMTTVTSLGLNTCIRHARQNYPEFSWMNDRDLMAFAKMRRDELADNLGVVLSYYKPVFSEGEKKGQFVQSTDLVDVMEEYQDDLRQMKIDIDTPVAWDAAFAANPVTHNIQDLQEMKTIFEQLADLKYQKREKLMMYVLGIAIVLVAGGVAVFLAGSAGG